MNANAHESCGDQQAEALIAAKRRKRRKNPDLLPLLCFFAAIPFGVGCRPSHGPAITSDSGTPSGVRSRSTAFRWSFAPCSPNDHRLPSANPAGWKGRSHSEASRRRCRGSRVEGRASGDEGTRCRPSTRDTRPSPLSNRPSTLGKRHSVPVHSQPGKPASGSKTTFDAAQINGSRGQWVSVDFSLAEGRSCPASAESRSRRSCRIPQP